MNIRIPMIFPGQASQQVGMATDLRERRGPGAEFLAAVDELLGYGLSDLMAGGPADTLTETRHAQPAILAHSVAVTLELAAAGIRPAVVAGHSLGEFSAAVAAGALTPATALRLVGRRGQLMWEAGEQRPGTMAAVLGLDAARVREVCERVAASEGTVVLANHNSPNQIAISGEVAAVAAASEELKAAGARRVVPLNVSGAFHSPLLQEAATAFATDLDAAAFADAAVDLVANVTAAPVRAASALREGLKAQLTAPVLWQDSVERIVAGLGDGPRVVLEVGPGQVLANLAKRTFPDVTFLSVGTAVDLDGLAERLAAAGFAGGEAEEAGRV